MRRKYCFTVLLVLIVFFSLSNKSYAQLHTRAMQQIELLLQEKESRTPAQKKINSHLLQAVREHRGEPMVKGLHLKSVNVTASTTGDLKVDISANVTDELIAKIQALGATIIYPSQQHHTIRALVNLSMIETISGYPEVNFIKPAMLAKTVGPGILQSTFVPHKTAVQSRLINYMLTHANITEQSPLTGSITSQGDRTHRADDARSVYGYLGRGVRIAVISDSYNSLHGAAADIVSGNLPGPGNPLGNTTPVTVVVDDTNGTDEGRAMLQIVHDVAPQAQLFFATADISEAAFADNIITLRNPPYNCDIIIDDADYLDEATFQDGLIAQAVDSVTNEGALYFSAAGNSGSVAKNSSGYFEGDFDSTGSAAFPVTNGKTGSIHNFGTISTPVNGDIITTNGEGHILTWADPYGASTNDYDLFLVSAADSIKDFSTDVQNGAQDPVEFINIQTLVAGDRLVVFKKNTAQVKAFAINTNRGRLTVSTTGQTHGHSSAINAFSVAATPAVSPGPYPNAFVSTNHVESFSSDGPRRIFYNADGTPVTSNNFLFATSGGTVRNKPDITAADGVSTTLPSGGGLNPFYGTSAATPHAAAIAALLKSANPALTPTQIRTLLISTALDIESSGYDINSGYGIVQAYAAMQALSPSPAAYIITDTVTTTEGSFGNGNGSIDPGELGNLVIQLSNTGILTSTNVRAILTTTYPGVTITQDSAYYDSIAVGAYNRNTAMPFQFGINSSISCSTVIPFTLTVTYSGGVNSSQTFIINVTIGNQPGANISSVLGGTPPNGPGFTATSGQQKGRLFRGTTASSCFAPLTNPGLTATTGNRQYDAYKFTNTDTVSHCVNVTMTSANGYNLYTAAYTSAGFVRTNPSSNFLADPGQSVIVQQYSFTAPASKAFTVVVDDINTTPASNSAYTLNVSLSVCAAAPPCTPDSITTVPIVLDSIGIPYTQSFAATGGSGAYLFSLAADSLPAGLSFVGNTISGTPTQAGIYPITITTTDAVGCPAATQTDTLIISNAVTYIFNGNGNWSTASNWVNNNIPPATITSGSQIIIDPIITGQCSLDIPYTLAPGATITVKQNKNFVIQGNLTITQ